MRSRPQASGLEQFVPAARLRLGRQRQVALAQAGPIVGEPLAPARRGVDVLGAVLGGALAYPAQDGGVDRCTGDDGLAFGEGRELLAGRDPPSGSTKSDPSHLSKQITRQLLEHLFRPLPELLQVLIGGVVIAP